MGERTNLGCSCRRASVLPVSLLVTLNLQMAGAGRMPASFGCDVEELRTVAVRKGDRADRERRIDWGVAFHGGKMEAV